MCGFEKGGKGKKLMVKVKIFSREERKGREV